MWLCVRLTDAWGPSPRGAVGAFAEAVQAPRTQSTHLPPPSAIVRAAPE